MDALAKKANDGVLRILTEASLGFGGNAEAPSGASSTSTGGSLANMGLYDTQATAVYMMQLCYKWIERDSEKGLSHRLKRWYQECMRFKQVTSTEHTTTHLSSLGSLPQ